MKNIDEELTNLLEAFAEEEPTSADYKVILSSYIGSIKQLFEPEGMLPLEERKKLFIDTVRPHIETMGIDEANRFAKYWMATSAKRPKYMAWEKEKSWNLEARIRNWMKNKKTWSIVGQLKRK